MNDELKKLIERFELEMWFYLDGTLPPEEKKFWDGKLQQYPVLKNMLEETTNTLQQYEVHSGSEISSEEIEVMLSNIKSGKNSSSVFNNLFNTIESFFSAQFTGLKVAAVGILSVSALLLLLTTDKPNAVKNISSEILSWQGTALNEDITRFENSLHTLSMDEWEKYKYIQATHDEWERSYYLLNNEIEKMKEDINDTSL